VGYGIIGLRRSSIAHHRRSWPAKPTLTHAVVSSRRRASAPSAASAKQSIEKRKTNPDPCGDRCRNRISGRDGQGGARSSLSSRQLPLRASWLLEFPNRRKRDSGLHGARATMMISGLLSLRIPPSKSPNTCSISSSASRKKVFNVLRSRNRNVLRLTCGRQG
jgi:hypothetical protein